METVYLVTANLLTILATKDSRTKEETIAYNEMLRYMSSLTRFNTQMIEAEIRRLDDEAINGKAGKHKASMP